MQRANDLKFVVDDGGQCGRKRRGSGEKERLLVGVRANEGGEEEKGQEREEEGCNSSLLGREGGRESS